MFTVEDGTAVAGSNAAASVAFCDDYHAERGNAGWTGSDAVKEQAIVRATDYMEARWGSLLKGALDETDVERFVSWPRVLVYDRNGLLVEGIPTKWQMACAEYALRALTDELNPDPTSDDSLVRRRKQVGPIEVEEEWSDVGGVTDLPEYPEADALVAEFVRGGKGRSIRA